MGICPNIRSILLVTMRHLLDLRFLSRWSDCFSKRRSSMNSTPSSKHMCIGLGVKIMLVPEDALPVSKCSLVLLRDDDAAK